MPMYASGWNPWVELDSSGNFTPSSVQVGLSCMGDLKSVKALPPCVVQGQ